MEQPPTPASPEAEKAVLGCISLSPQQCLAECGEAGIVPETFHESRHGIIYKAMVELGQFDTISLSEKLKGAGLLDAVGGITYLSSLADSVPSAHSLSHYIPIVKDKAKLRRLRTVCGEATAGAQSCENVDELLDKTEKDILSIRDEKGDSDTKTSKVLVLEAGRTIERYVENQGKIDGLSTGLPDLDRLTWGLHEAEIIVVAGRPSAGKTSLVMQIADHVAVDQRQPVAIFSLETIASKLMLRMKCSRARVDKSRVRRGEIDNGDVQKLSLAGIQLARAPLYIRDRTGININYLKAAARRMHQQYGIKLFIIDYLQLMSSQTKRGENREREVAQVSNGIKSIANDLKVPVMVISALNRDCENENRKPRLSDLRESGQLEFDADVAWSLYRPAAQQGQVNNPTDKEHQVNLDVLKNKEEGLGTVPLWFKKQYTRFESMKRVEE